MNYFGKLEVHTTCDVCFEPYVPCVTIHIAGYVPNHICVCKRCLIKMIKELERYE